MLIARITLAIDARDARQRASAFRRTDRPHRIELRPPTGSPSLSISESIPQADSERGRARLSITRNAADLCRCRRRAPAGKIVRGDPLFAANRDQIARLALQHALPTLAEGRVFVSARCLVSYAPKFSGLNRGMAVLVDKAFKGAKPGDASDRAALGVRACDKSETAKPLGISIPQSVLLRADEVIPVANCSVDRG